MLILDADISLLTSNIWDGALPNPIPTLPSVAILTTSLLAILNWIFCPDLAFIIVLPAAVCFNARFDVVLLSKWANVAWSLAPALPIAAAPK